MQRDDLIDALECEFATLFRATRRLGQQVAHEVHPDLDLNAYLLLLHLTQACPTRLTDMADAFNVGKATMSRQLTALESLGLLERLPDPADGRAAMLRLTDDGRERLLAARQTRRDHRLGTTLRHWDPADLVALTGLLRRLNHALDPS